MNYTTVAHFLIKKDFTFCKSTGMQIGINLDNVPKSDRKKIFVKWQKRIYSH